MYLPDVQAGDVVSIPIGMGFRHYGVVTLTGSVISRSSRHGGVVEQTLLDFSDGRSVRRHPSSSRRHPIEIDARARRRLGADYDLTRANCVHHVRWVHGRTPTVTQRVAATLQIARDMLGPPKRRR